ncbi:hypothetical protein [Paludisphaera rhizosphaerae]|uniref:hypothetical protein n=1 Tax=Paludisphaera rhizosphaerae TaxID=2711216 RepID=UPI0013EDEDFF|nr:hypothetical protein [Paludisphaera rhizosphaerae]
MLRDFLLEIGSRGWPIGLAFTAAAVGAVFAASAALAWAWNRLSGRRARRLLARAMLALHSDAELTRIAAGRGWISSSDLGPRPVGELEHRVDLERLAGLREAAEAAGYEYRAARSEEGYYTVALVRRDDICHCSSRSQFRASLTAAALAMGGGPWKLLNEDF